MDLVPGDIISGSIAFTGYYELNLTRTLWRIARRGGIMIDVGANLGYFSLLWIAARVENRCLAFEASPRVIPLLRKNIEKNQALDRIQIFPVAAGDKHGSLPFKMGRADQTGWGGFSNAPDDQAVSVDVVRLDETVQEQDPIDLLKIDIEGADTWALKGCEGLLKQRRIRRIWFEQNKPRMRRLGIGEDEAVQFLHSVGYIARAESPISNEVVDWSAYPADMSAFRP
jgi:FkbM family methyltransferase